MFDEILHNKLKSMDAVCVCYVCGQTESGVIVVSDLVWECTATYFFLYASRFVRLYQLGTSIVTFLRSYWSSLSG